MVFSSITFLFVFLPVFLIVYNLLDSRYKNIFLLLASLFFYYWGEPKFLIVMVLSIIWNWLGGLACARSQAKALKTVCLALAVLGNLALLIYFKYFNFVLSIVNDVFQQRLLMRDIILPVGISFFTFQGLSYVIDVYRGEVSAQKNPLKIGLYISLFPQLIAGPIVRYQDIEKEISQRSVTWENLYSGIKRFVFGLSKKVIIANTLAFQADQIFALNTENISQSTAILGAVLYSLQIFFDFSGYSDMAIGLGETMGFHFMENFNLPYISRSVKEFWRRWHISLSTWFRDYLYIPLGGNRRGNVYLNLLIVFFMTGLWHGASWNFVVWGLWHGAFLILERVLVQRGLSLPNNIVVRVFKHCYTLLVVLVGWVMFRADTLQYAMDYLKIMFGLKQNVTIFFDTAYYMDRFTLFILCAGVLFSTKIPTKIKDKISSLENLKAVSVAAEGIALVVLMLICAMMIMASTYNPFIYFRF